MCIGKNELRRKTGSNWVETHWYWLYLSLVVICAILTWETVCFHAAGQDNRYNPHLTWILSTYSSFAWFTVINKPYLSYTEPCCSLCPHSLSDLTFNIRQTFMWLSALRWAWPLCLRWACYGYPLYDSISIQQVHTGVRCTQVICCGDSLREKKRSDRLSFTTVWAFGAHGCTVHNLIVWNFSHDWYKPLGLSTGTGDNFGPYEWKSDLRQCKKIS